MNLINNLFQKSKKLKEMRKKNEVQNMVTKEQKDNNLRRKLKIF